MHNSISIAQITIRFSLKSETPVHKSNDLPYNGNTIFLIYAANGTKEEYPKAQSASAAALDVFSLYGFSGASLDEIAQLADMHKSNIFYYYENKESLYVEVLTTVLQNG